MRSYAPEQRREWDKSYRERNRDSLRGRNSVHAKKHYEANKDKILAKLRDKTHGLLPGEYDEMFKAQSGCCQLCGAAAAVCARGKLFVDHCHRTGVVRGLLCGACNTGLGFIEKHRHEIDRYLGYADGRSE